MSASQQTLQEQLAPVAQQVITRDAYFSPTEYIDEVLTDERLKQQLASNLAWAINSTMVSVATAMYFEVSRENPELSADVGKLMDNFVGNYDHEGIWGEGNARTLVKLVTLQPSVHELATRTAVSAGFLNYRPRSLDELVTRQSAFKIREQELANLKVAAEYIVSQGDGQQSVDEVLKQLIDQRTMRNEDMAKMRRGLLPAVRVFVEQARKHSSFSGDDDTIRFSDLPTMTQLFVVRMQRDAIPRIITDLAPRVDTAQYTMILVEANAAKKTYARVVDKLARDLDNERTVD